MKEQMRRLRQGQPGLKLGREEYDALDVECWDEMVGGVKSAVQRKTYKSIT